MATPQYVEGPEAKAMESGFELDNLLRRERGANKRQMIGLAGQRGMADVNQAHALARMLEADKLKEAGAQREAERTVPFLQTMIQGNPKAAQGLGFGAMEPGPSTDIGTPEAGIPGAPGKPMFVPRQPSREEVTGLSRAVPGITQALLQQSMKGTEGYSLAPGAKRFSGDNQLVAENPKAEGSNMLFPTGRAAMEDAIKNGMNPDDVRIVTTKDGVQWMSRAEPVAQGPNIWQAQITDPNTTDAQQRQAQQNLNDWEAREKRIAVMKEGVKPFAPDIQMKLDKQNESIQSSYQLLKFTPTERKQFTGLVGRGESEVKSIIGSAAEALGITNPFDPELNQRFQDFKRLNGMVEQYKFAIGGKQLTEGEQRVVNAFIPTGRELSPYEYEAKLRGLVGVMEAEQEVALYLAQTGKADVKSPELRAIFLGKLQGKGIDIEKMTTQDAVRAQMNSDQRLRNKYLENK